MDEMPVRQRLSHAVPVWVRGSTLYFVTICTEPRRRNQLAVPRVGSGLLESAAYYHEMQRWWLKLILLMPDHIHALVTVPKAASLPDVVRMWKSYQSKQWGIVWQTGFFDHRLRSGESEQQKTDYILMNPVRAGLVAKPEDWPYVWPEDYADTAAARPEDSPYR